MIIFVSYKYINIDDLTRKQKLKVTCSFVGTIQTFENLPQQTKYINKNSNIESVKLLK